MLLERPTEIPSIPLRTTSKSTQPPITKARTKEAIPSRETDKQVPTSATSTPVVGLSGMENVYKPEDFSGMVNQANKKIKALCESVYRYAPLNVAVLEHEILFGNDPVDAKKQLNDLPPLTVQDAKFILDKIDEISNQLCLCLDFLELVRCLHPDSQFRTAAIEATNKFSIVLHELNNDDRLYESMKRIDRDSELMNQLAPLDQHCLQVLKKDMEKYGSVGQLSHHERKHRLIELNSMIGQYVAQFSDIVAHHREELSHEFWPIRSISSSEPMLQHLRKTYPKLFKSDMEQDGNELISVHSSAKKQRDGSLRKVAYIASHCADPRALNVLDELLEARQELALTMNKPSYAHHALQSLMVGSPEKVIRFLDDLSEKIKPQAEKEVSLLRQEKILEEGESCDHTVYAWDFDFYKRACMNRYVSESSVARMSDYLHYKNCLNGIYMVCEKLFKIKMVEVPVKAPESWHDDIIKLELYDTEHDVYLGDLYLDIFYRKGKIGDNSNFCRQAAKTSIGQKTVSVLVHNIQSEYLTMSELLSMFHELGHAIHTFLGRTPYQNLSGTRVSVDWVEMPSQFMEHFAADFRVVSQFAKHHRTGEPLPKKLFDECMFPKKMFRALNVQNQVVYSMLDLMLHMNEHKNLNISTTQLLYRIRAKYHSLPITQNDEIDQLHPISYHGNLLHLTNYASSYYSYLYAKISSDHLWFKKFNSKDDPLDSEAAASLKRAMSYGGSRRESDILMEVLGEEPSPSFFLREFME